MLPSVESAPYATALKTVLIANPAGFGASGYIDPDHGVDVGHAHSYRMVLAGECAMGKVVKMVSSAAGGPASESYFLSGSDRARHGVNIGQAMRAGLLTTEDFRALLALCRDCPDGQGRHDEFGEAPESCANRMILEALRGIV